MSRQILYDIVVGRSLNYGIGRKGTLPWKLPSDLKMFKKITTSGKSGNTIIMGRKTFESMSSKPLPNRNNIVVTSSKEFSSGNSLHKAESLEEALLLAKQLNPETEIFVIGGEKVFREAIPNCRYVYETLVNKKIEDCDVFIPEHSFPNSFVSKTLAENGLTFDYRLYYNPKQVNKENIINQFQTEKHQEYQYIEAIRNIIETGEQKIDRTKTGTKSIFGGMMKYDLRQTFPLLTHKRVFWRGLAEELLWFVKGSTNAKQLQQKKIHIWDGNSSKEYMESIGIFDREAGDLGPVYGYQWRHWNAPYKDMHTDYTGKGVDQLQWIVNEIKKNPTSRRLILSAWNPEQMSTMALPPCHLLSQFYVTNDNRLSCILYQRSCDMGLGVPFNIASYSLLTCLMAQVTGLGRGDFIHMMGDMHVYNDHIDSLKNLSRVVPYPFPTLEIDPSVKDIDGFRFQHFKLNGYSSHKKIQMKMSV